MKPIECRLNFENRTVRDLKEAESTTTATNRGSQEPAINRVKDVGYPNHDVIQATPKQIARVIFTGRLIMNCAMWLQIVRWEVRFSA